MRISTTPTTRTAARLATLAALLTVLLVLLATAPARADAGTVRTTTAQRSAAAAIALRKVGAPYQWGASGPRRFDCSGLVLFAYSRAGRSLGVRTSQQMWKLGRGVRRGMLRRGDLVWTWDRSLGHVGIYVGGGRYVHAPGAGRRVSLSTLPSGSGFIGGRRP